MRGFLLVIVVAGAAAGCIGGPSPNLAGSLFTEDEPGEFVISPASSTGARAQAINVIAAAAGLTTSEGGQTASLTVRLARVPTANVTLTIASSNTAEGIISTGSSLTFTTANWSTAQSVIVTGVNDLVADGTQQFLVNVANTTSTDASYNGISGALVLVTNLDDDKAVSVLAANGLTTGKDGSTAHFTFKLNSQPTANVTVGISSSDTDSAIVSASSLVFTSANWSTVQTVTITGQTNFAQTATGGGTRYYVTVGPYTSDDSNYTSLPTQQLLCTQSDTDLNRVVPVAGLPFTPGSSDGTGAAARLNGPLGGLAIDASGNIYVADSGNNMIRKISKTGVVSTIAGATGSGTADGTGTLARFNTPRGLVIDSTGNIYVADAGNNTIRKITTAGVVSTFSGVAGATGTTVGAATIARYRFPEGIAIDSSGVLYVVDSNNEAVRKIVAGVSSAFVGMAGSSGSTNGVGTTALFTTPQAIAGPDVGGNLYVADTNTIRKITSNGYVTTFAGQFGANSYLDATGTNARFGNMYGLSLEAPGGAIYVADMSNNKVRKITPAGVVTTVFGLGGSMVYPVASTLANITSPSAVVYSNSAVFVASSTGDVVVRVSDTTRTGCAELMCSSTCTNSVNDKANCGGCGVSCGANACCGASCTDLTTSSNCGSCGNVCSGGKSCQSGVCTCPSGATDCAGTCVYTSTSTTNCGGCGVTCGGGQVCSNGSCVSSSTCDYQLPNAFDTLNIGGTFGVNGTTPFSLTGQLDDFGILVKDGDAPTATWGSPYHLTLPANYILYTATGGYFGGSSDFVMDDPNGHHYDRGGFTGIQASGTGFPYKSLGDTISTAEINARGWGGATLRLYLFTDAGDWGATASGVIDCSGGCATGSALCSTAACHTFSSDYRNCGSCGHDCGNFAVCSSGVCGGCGGGLSACYGTCVDTNTDNLNCGGCNNFCGLACSGGVCGGGCGGGQVNCGAGCTDTSSDSNNCGGCGSYCSGYCSGGTCYGGGGGGGGSGSGGGGG